MTATPIGEQTQVVEVLCRCPDIEDCDMERYVSDVRIAAREREEALRLLEMARAAGGVPVAIIYPDAFPKVTGLA